MIPPRRGAADPEPCLWSPPRLRTVAAKRFKRVEKATAVIWKPLLLAERRFRRLNTPELLEEVWNGAQSAGRRRLNHIHTPIDGSSSAASTGKTCFVTVARPEKKVSATQTANFDISRWSFSV